MPNYSREPLVSLDAAAEHLSVSRRTLERHIEHARIPAYKLGRAVRVRLSEIEDSLGKLGSVA